MQSIGLKMSCSDCKHSVNIRVCQDVAQWYCHNTPAQYESFEGDYELEFKTFYCSRYENVFKDVKNV